MKQLLKNTFRRLGYELVRCNSAPAITASELESLSDLSEAERKIVESVKPFTLTGVARIATLLNAVNYVSANRIPGDIAECGVWRGGSMMAVALALLARGDTGRKLYLYDTFEGMPAPTDKDKSHDGLSAADQLRQTPRGSGVWCYADLEDVR